MTEPRRGVIFVAWGERHVAEVTNCLRASRLDGYPVFLLTDEETEVAGLDDRVEVIRTRFDVEGLKGLGRKCELGRHIPDGFDSLVFLDADTRVIDDISLAFEKAERYGIAAAQAPHYDLGHFHDFAQIMVRENIEPRGQIVYNTGVVFFSPTPAVMAVFDRWEALAHRYADAGWSDQPYFTLAMELLGFNPYTLSTSYNHRAMGEWASGLVRIWHSYQPVPEGVNDIAPGAWPRAHRRGRMVDTRPLRVRIALHPLVQPLHRQVKRFRTWRAGGE